MAVTPIVRTPVSCRYHRAWGRLWQPPLPAIIRIHNYVHYISVHL